MTRTVFADGSFRWKGDSFIIALHRLKPGCVFVSVQGQENAEVRTALMHELAQEIERTKLSGGAIHVFVDMRGNTRVDSEGRDQWSHFGRTHLKQIARTVILVQSRLIEMAMTVMGLFIGGGIVKTVSQEKEFIRELAVQIPGTTVIPRLPGDGKDSVSK